MTQLNTTANLNAVSLIRSDLIEALNMKNADGKTVFDILLENNSLQFIFKLIDYIPASSHMKIINKINQNPTLLFNLQNTESKLIYPIYASCVDYQFIILRETKKKIIYDLVEYQKRIGYIEKILSYLNNNYKDLGNQPLEWLYHTLMLNQDELFCMIMNKYFPNDQDEQAIAYLTSVLDEGCSLISKSIQLQNMRFIKHLFLYSNPMTLQTLDLHQKNAIIYALETKSIPIIKLVKFYSKGKKGKYMDKVIDNYLEVLEGNQKIIPESFKLFVQRTWNQLLKLYEQ